MLSRYLFTGTLELLSPLHIGSGKASDITDSPVRTGVDGRPLVPGTALGGLLRSQAERFAPFLAIEGNHKCLGSETTAKACDCAVCHLFGAVDPTTELDRTSRLVIRDAVAIGELGPPQIRDGIGISRQRATVAQNLKFDLAVLPANSRFAFEVRLDSDEIEQVQLLGAVLAEMMEGRMRLGGRSGRGTGRFRLKLEKVAINGFEAGETGLANLKKYLKAKPDERRKLALSGQESGPVFIKNQLHSLKIVENSVLPPPNFLEAEIRLEFEQGLIINNPALAILEASDSTFVRTAHFADGKSTLYLPGSSLRGMLRAQAERIARTLSYSFTKDNQALYGQKVAACDPLTGSDEKEPNGEPYPAISCAHYLRDQIEKQKQLGLRNKELAAWIDQYSCLACRLFGHTYRAGRLKISDAFPVAAALDPHGSTLRRLDFVAINRFTGGARDTAKFDAIAHFPPQPVNEQRLSFQFSLSLSELDADNDGWVVGWLAFVLRDLFLGELRLGTGKTKGLGQVKGSLVSLTFGGLNSQFPSLFAPDKKAEATPSGLFQVYRFTADDLNAHKQLLTGYAHDFYTKVEGFQRERAGQRNG